MRSMANKAQTAAARQPKQTRRHVPHQADVALIKSQRHWVRVKVAEDVTGFSRSTILRIIADPANKIRNYLHKTRPDAQSGSRMIYLPDLLEYFNRSAEAAQAASRL
jgi:hypothetical protein